MARLQETSETVIALQILVMNLECRLRILFYLFFKELFSRKVWRNILFAV